MRLVFIGAGDLTVATAWALAKQDHEVVVIERDRARIDELSADTDVSFLHGDGSTPDLLQEAGPESTDILFCMTDSDQANIIASLVGRSLGFARVITRIQDAQFEPICNELRLDNVIIPDRTISRYLQDLVRGVDIIELSTALKGPVRLLSFTADREESGPVEKLELPQQAKAVLIYRDDTFVIVEPDTAIKRGDEVILLTHSRNIQELRERWNPHETAAGGET